MTIPTGHEPSSPTSVAELCPQVRKALYLAEKLGRRLVHCLRFHPLFSLAGGTRRRRVSAWAGFTDEAHSNYGTGMVWAPGSPA